ncbi:hypothetical protein [Clostridium tagluense]|uniref:hypothetical protein n=1 Tax=Clostridium tagluense TaxID=360422 RepID=UPI001CF393FD|nr:hypothetical protein [Clostridium tagluense]MCB2299896.1 hypothetical protein [Clostridium tagluense]
MNKREILKTVIAYICYMGIGLSNAGLCLSCLLIFRGIISKQTECIIFSLEMFAFFMVALQLSNHFKHFLD